MVFHQDYTLFRLQHESVLYSQVDPGKNYCIFGAFSNSQSDKTTYRNLYSYFQNNTKKSFSEYFLVQETSTIFKLISNTFCT